MNSEELLKKRMQELSKRAFSQGRYFFSEFLNLAEQDIVLRTDMDYRCRMFGGYESAERKLAVFGDEEICGYEEEPPVTCIMIQPENKKFADTISHRDFLGGLMSLGLRRSVLGDIIVHDNVGYLFCLDSIADYVIEELRKVRHTNVICTRTEELPEKVVRLPDITEIVIASERLDAIIAAVYRLSRADSQKLFEQKKVFLNSRLTEKTSATVEESDIISVRGYGRFIYEGICRETKRGRLRVQVRIF